MMIREAALRDARGIAEVHVRAWQAAYSGIIPDEELERLSVDQREQLWSRILSQGEDRTYILLNQDLVVGWSGFGPSRDEESEPEPVAELYGIYLLPEYWGMGLGKKLYKATETRIRQKQFTHLILWVFEKNARARGFYESIGFRLETDKRKEICVAGANAFVVRYDKIVD